MYKCTVHFMYFKITVGDVMIRFPSVRVGTAIGICDVNDVWTPCVWVEGIVCQKSRLAIASKHSSTSKHAGTSFQRLT